jgi:DNA-binding transcriptional ArsR family regulator
MEKDCFRKYIDDVESGISCEQFLTDHKKIVANLKLDHEFKRNLMLHNALSNEIRHLIYKILEFKPMCTCALAQIFEKTNATITHHLKILEEANLIIGRKKGYYTIYYSKEALIEEISV